ncbi:MAG TPA: Ldh family oxidoreductase [Stellaceae bacterium]|nr:Ldh family oxidoreductase [Stellaceae bacterium]
MIETVPASDLRDLATRGLVAAGATEPNAASAAVALIAAELDGLPSHGLSRLPFYAEQISRGKVDGKAMPTLSRPAAAMLHVDAHGGLAFPAIDLGFAAIPGIARESGVIALGIANSHHAGVVGHHVERLATQGLVAIAFANTPAAIAPFGGTRGIFGTNPIAFACPRRNNAPLVIDLSISIVARGKLLIAASKGEAIPPGWALDKAGNPTTDAQTALAGTIVPIGGAKGAALALMVEILAAGLTGSQFGFEASSFFDAEGPPPRTGQLFLALDPSALAGPSFRDRIEALCAAMLADPAVRLPGERRLASRSRFARDGIPVPAKLLAELRQRAAA